jgi:hypothetical protein
MWNAADQNSCLHLAQPTSEHELSWSRQACGWHGLRSQLFTHIAELKCSLLEHRESATRSQTGNDAEEGQTTGAFSEELKQS